MADKRLLYFAATRVYLYRWAHGKLALESSFANSEEGAHAFAAHLPRVSSSLFYLLVDIVEEDFHQENVPFVRGADRRTLLARKLTQRYRDTTLSLAASLGYEKTQRRDERILFSSFTNNAQFQPWFTALREQEVAVAGVYSVALLAPQLATKLGARKASLLLVTLQLAGLRQTYLENGKTRFSRLGPIEAAEASDPNRLADAFDRETTRVYQYLTATRILAREGAAIDALLIAPTGEKHRVQAAGPNLPQINAAVVDLREAASAIGLKQYPAQSGAEVLFLHLLAKRAPRAQYAAAALRQYYQLHQVRAGLVAGGAAICLLAIAYAGVQLAQRYTLENQIRVDRHRAQAATEAYRQVTATSPRLPTTPENLRATMEKYAQLTRQTAPPEHLVADVSRALDASPQIELDRLRWEIGPNPKDKLTGGSPARAQGAAPSAVAGPVYEIAELSGRVTVAGAADVRTITLTVNEFLDMLRKRPGVEVTQTRMPFEFGSESRLSGDIGVQAAARAPQFSVTVARRLGS